MSWLKSIPQLTENNDEIEPVKWLNEIAIPALLAPADFYEPNRIGILFRELNGVLHAISIVNLIPAVYFIFLPPLEVPRNFTSNNDKVVKGDLLVPLCVPKSEWAQSVSANLALAWVTKHAMDEKILTDNICSMILSAQETIINQLLAFEIPKGKEYDSLSNTLIELMRNMLKYLNQYPSTQKSIVALFPKMSSIQQYLAIEIYQRNKMYYLSRLPVNDTNTKTVHTTVQALISTRAKFALDN